MGFFDFLRKKKEEIKETEKEISLVELESQIKDKLNEYSGSSKDIKKSIKESVSLLISELKTGNESVKNIDLKERKENERLKLIVRENLYFYVNYVDKLIKDLEKIREDLETEEYIMQINSVFDNFKKNSNKSFEKSTILVGKELEKMQETIRNFFQKLNGVISENRDIFEKTRILNRTEAIRADLIENRKICLELKKGIERLESENKKLSVDKIEFEKEFDKFKTSEEYSQFLEETKKREKEKEDLEKEIFKLKERINLKGLLKYFHSDSKKSKIILGYIENFIAGLGKDADMTLAKMVNEVFKSDIKKELEQIKEANEKLREENWEKKAGRKIEVFESEIRKTEFDISRIKEEAESERKKLIKFEERENYLLDEISKKASEILGKVKVKF